MRLQEYKGLDPRGLIFLLLYSSVAGMLARSEAALLLLFSIALLLQIIGGNAGKIPGYIIGFLVFWGIARLGVLWLSVNPSFSLAITVTNMGIAVRRVIIPVLFAVLLSKVPVGTFMAGLGAMRLPRQFAIGTAILLRFFPTIGEEYRAIRSAMKFRGIGVGFWHTLLHLPKVIRYLFIPLTIRIAKISEELSASVTVRGVCFDAPVVSLREARLRKKDVISLIFCIASITAVMLFDMGILKGVTV